MCTMLSFVTTDAAISKELLQKALSASVQDTYNMISVDGDTSTNDTALLLANGEAGNPKITEENEDYAAFVKALNEVNTYLAKHMAADGEGASALFEVKVTGAAKMCIRDSVYCLGNASDYVVKKSREMAEIAHVDLLAVYYTHLSVL